MADLFLRSSRAYTSFDKCHWDGNGCQTERALEEVEPCRRLEIATSVRFSNSEARPRHANKPSGAESRPAPEQSRD